MKDEIGQKIMTKFAGPRANSYSYQKQNLNLRIIKTV